MKIISLRLNNINALKGQWYIDFSQEPFASSGLFAITGPTGAGKTTLLDAICLALYHRTPRINEPSPADKVMTRHTSECSAEVVFEVKHKQQNKRYRAFWERRRARGASDGKLQPAKVELAELSAENNGLGDKIIADKIKDKDALIAEITGLDFGRFTKSMLLAQGGFAAFLNADAGERADLLEELTGTEIYGKVSEQVFIRFRDEEAKLHLLREQGKHVEVLGAEAMAELKSQQQQHEEQVITLQQQSQHHQQILDTIKQLKDADTQQQQTQTNTQKAIAAIAEHQDDLHQLANSIPANHLRPLLNTLEQEQLALDQLMGVATSLTGQQQQEEQALQDLAPLLHEQQHTVDTLAIELSHTQQLITEQVIPLDAEIKQLSHQHAEFTLEKNTYETGYAQQQHEAEALKDTLDTSREYNATIETYLNSHANDQHLQANLPLWQAKFSDRENLYQKGLNAAATMAALQKEAVELTQTQDQQQEILQTAQADLALANQQNDASHQALALVVKGETPDAITARYQQYLSQQDALSRCQHIFERYQEHANKQKEQGGLLQQKQQDQEASTATVEQLRQQYQQQQKLIAEIENTVQLERSIASLQSYRDALQSDDACPLCGSTEHPAIDRYHAVNSSVSESRLAQEKLTLEALTQQGTAAKDQLIAHRTQCQHIEETLQETAQLLSQCIEQWQAPAGELSWRVLLTDPTASVLIPELLAQAKQEKQQADIQQQALVLAEQQAQAAHQTLVEQEQTLQRCHSDAILLEEKKVHNNQQISALLDQQHNLNAELSDLETQLNQQLHTGQWSLPEVAEQALWLTERQTDNAQYLDKTAHLEDNQKAVLEQEQALNTLSQQQLSQQQNIEQVQAKLTQLQDTLEQQKAQRHSLFGDKNTTQETQQLSLLLSQHETSLQALKDKANIIKTALHTLQAQFNDNTQAIAAQQLTTQAAQTQWLEALNSSPFSSDADLRAALLDDQEQKRMTDLKQHLDAQRLQAQTLQQKATDEWQVAKEQAGRIAELAGIEGESPQTLDERIGEFSAHISEASTLINNANKQLGEIEQQFKTDQEKRLQQQTLVADIAKQEQHYNDWDTLKSLIGSADGKKFRVFAQGLTLDYLIQLANSQLAQLHNRYQLHRKNGEALELEVMDTWQADTIRDTKTLSGGESFLVSLALALALSDLVSHKTKIDSLFLDEGFGTLDRETLDIALDALDNLNASGKMIGVISHVDALKERIPVQIAIKKMSGLGVSKLASQYAVQ